MVLTDSEAPGRLRLAAVALAAVAAVGCVEQRAPNAVGHGIADRVPMTVDPQRALAQTAFDHAIRGGMPSNAVLLLVRIDAQRMDMIARATTVCTFTVSTSKFGVGHAEGSNKTPVGLHEVVRRIGDGEPAGRVFKNRQVTDLVIPEADWRRPSAADFVVSRIFRLAGREHGVNQGPGIDSFDRCIYIHGTNEEHLLGQPASHGCVRMANREVIDLFNAVRNRPVWCCLVQSDADLSRDLVAAGNPVR